MIINEIRTQMKDNKSLMSESTGYELCNAVISCWKFQGWQFCQCICIFIDRCTFIQTDLVNGETSTEGDISVVIKYQTKKSNGKVGEKEKVLFIVFLQVLNKVFFLWTNEKLAGLFSSILSKWQVCLCV